MKIAIIIPSFNEEDNISNIVKIVDRGLSKYYPNSESVIINVDSDSQDSTVERFLNIPTKFPKNSIVNKDIPRGKGSNIRKAILHYKNSVDYFLMLDSDVISVKEIWIKKFLEPLIKGKAQMVAPVYTRNRYEGNTTNHFSSPIYFACFNKDFVQPIAGDFSFTNKLTDFCNNMVYLSDYMYGIDTVITFNAVLKGYKINQIKIGQKLHKPSFPKIVPMFEQVASTTFRLINGNRKEITKSFNTKKNNLKKYKIIDEKFIRPISNERVQEVKNLAICQIKKYPPPDFINKNLYKSKYLSSLVWINILSEYLIYLLLNDLNVKQIDDLAGSITSLYLFRVFGYFREINGLSPVSVDELLFEEKILLRQFLLKELKDKFVFEPGK